MRAVIQRVRSARITVATEVIGSCGPGLLVLLGVAEGDGLAEVDALVSKTARLRIFADEEGRMNRSMIDVSGEALVVSQFTLCADTRKGNRPSFAHAAAPSVAAPLIDRFVTGLRESGVSVETGSFGADMLVTLENDGPVTMVLDQLPG